MNGELMVLAIAAYYTQLFFGLLAFSFYIAARLT